MWVEPPKRCFECENCYLDRSLQYYHVYRCKINEQEIQFNSENGWDRMKWCPLVTEDIAYDDKS